MTCFEPLNAYLPLDCDLEGKRRLIFSEKKIYEFKRSTVLKLEKYNILPKYNINDAFDDIYSEDKRFPLMYVNHDLTDDYPDGLLIQVPCGHCDGCRIDYSRRWAIRGSNEAFMHNHYQNCSFLSLTFNENALRRTNLGYSVDKAFFKSWVKRLRYYVKEEFGSEFRHLSCGEYGSKNGRPHYHMIIFGFNFPDKYTFKLKHTKKSSYFLYRSPFLEKLWHLPGCTESAGYSSVCEVNFNTCAYVARYVTKKRAKHLYGDQQPEFLSVSRMPGIGYSFCEKYLNDIFNHGYIMNPDGFKCPIPRYYESICEKLNPELYYNYKYEKFQRLYNEMLQRFSNASNLTKKRLSALAELQTIRNNQLVRELENESVQIAF